MARKVFVCIFILTYFMFLKPQVSDADVISQITIKELIVKHAVELGLDPALALSIAKAESNFCHEKKSKYGAVGVFQLMPSTAKKLGYNPYYLNDNIKGGIAYYKMMYKMFGTTELALAAYNAGPGNVKKYNGIPPFIETKKFVTMIMKSYKNLKDNPDPAITNYQNSMKNISDVKPKDEESDLEKEQEEIINLYLSNQGV